MQPASEIFNPIPARFCRISGSALKTVAVITMLIDHIGAGILLPIVLNGLSLGPLSRSGTILLYYVTRRIGRTAFPIFCFLLVEGFLHTKSRPRYALSLFVFALVSEIPFDLALIPGNELSHTLAVGEVLSSNKTVYFRDQNVFFTLLIGFLVIWFTETVFHRAAKAGKQTPALKTPAVIIAGLISFLAALSGCYGADALFTDYDHKGITLIIVLYLLHRFRPVQLGAAYLYISLFGTNEVWSLPGFLLMLLYNGERGFIKGKMKYAFYAFYPVHLTLIYIIRTFLL